MIAGKDLDLAGGRDVLHAALQEKLGRPVSKQSLCMAITGYRKTDAYAEILGALKEILCDPIHQS